MLSFLCIIAFVVTASAKNHCDYDSEIERIDRNELEDRIIGGFNLDISHVPYQVSLQVGNQHTCGGSILTNRYVLTAAHCILGNNKAHWNRMQVRVGSSLHNQGGQTIPVVNFHWHNQYVGKEYDIAILKLSAPIQFNSNVQPVGLPNCGAPLPVGGNALASGWGYTRPGGKPGSDFLQGIYLEILDPRQCERAFAQVIIRFLAVVQLCAGVLRGGSCNGDSGGPLAINGIQYGIVSWGGEVCGTTPTTFADVAKLRHFISEVARI